MAQHIVRVALRVIVIAAVVLFVLSLSGFLQAIRPSKIISTVRPSDFGLTYEDVAFRTADGLTLRGWYIRGRTDAHGRVIVLLHGYPADKGDVLPTMAWLADTYDLLLFDFRSFGASDGRITTAGAREVRDLAAAVDFLRGRGAESIGVWGFSMGGAVALMGAAELPGVRAVVADSSYARLDLLAQELYPIPLLRRPLGALTVLWTRLLLGVDLRRVSPADAAVRIAVPVLLIHSPSDDQIPFAHAQAIAEQLRGRPNAALWFPEDRIHGVFDRAYLDRVAAFFTAHLSVDR